MRLEERIRALVALGKYLEADDEKLEAAIELAYMRNKWFTKENVIKALGNISKYFLKEDILKAWISNYQLPDDVNSKSVGLILAGNIPAVGFHDILCCFVVGHKVKIKTSEKDDILIKLMVQKLIAFDERAEMYFQFIERLSDFDAVIATGSNNSSGYFQSYFSKYPNIIRKNRNGVAVLAGQESDEDLRALSDDIFDYFGLGCRSVSKIYIPQEYDLNQFMEVTHERRQIVNHSKYKNNFDYNSAIFILNKDIYYSNGSVLVKEDKNIASRIASLHYERYTDKPELISHLQENVKNIQCICSLVDLDPLETINFGTSQIPEINCYADDVDTLAFLINL